MNYGDSLAFDIHWRVCQLCLGNKPTGIMKKIILPLLSLLLLASTADARFWANQEGISFEGELVEVIDNAVTIRRTSDRRKFTVNIKDLSQDDQDYLKKLAEEKKLEEEKKAEEEAKNMKPKSSKEKLPTSEKRLAKWLVGTEWTIMQGKLDSGAGGAVVRRFYRDGLMQFQDGISEWNKNLKFQEDKYHILSENSIEYGGLRWIIVFDEKFETFTGVQRADETKTCVGKFVIRFK